MLINRKLLGCACAGVMLVAMGTAQADGNRYDRERVYAKDISVSEAYLAMGHSKGWNNQANNHQPKPVLIDVRRLREYAAGHPEDAYNVPYPHIINKDQTAETFYWEVYDIVNGNLDTPIMLLCRTGSRSIDAGNILADPENQANDSRRSAVVGGLKFTNVTNIWEGFVGQPLYAFAGSTIKVDIVNDKAVVYPLDLNNDGILNDDYADVYEETEDANPDKDGWRNFAGLPWTTKIRRPLAYTQDPWLYEALNLTPVQ